MIRKLAWATTTFLAVLLATYSAAALVVPIARPDQLRILPGTMPNLLLVACFVSRSKSARLSSPAAWPRG